MKLLDHSNIVVHCGHHKSGSTWLAYIISAICKEFGLRMKSSYKYWDISYYTGASFLNSYTSEVTFDHPNYIASHMIRDPRDVIVSAAFYHRWTKEEWFHVKEEEFDGVTYQEKLNTLSVEDGIMFEMNHFSSLVIGVMSRWNYSNPKVLEFHYEDLIENHDEMFLRLFRHWGILPEHLEQCLEIAKGYHMTRLTGRKVGEEQVGSHLRSGKPGQWKEHFTPTHKAHFKEKFGDILIRLGYEKSNDW